MEKFYKQKKGRKNKRFSSSYDCTFEIELDEDEEIQEIIPKNGFQKTYLKYLYDPIKTIVFAIGSAGTGKTFLSCNAAITELQTDNYRKIVICRPTVNVDNESLGYLPGNVEDKVLPYLRPIVDILLETFTYTQIQHMIKEKIIEMCPLAYMRGRTFDYTFIIGDEMQNASVSQMKMLLTRVGRNSKLIVTGDLDQIDRKSDTSGLQDIINRIRHQEKMNEQLKTIKVIEFPTTSIERSDVIKEILDLYNAT